MGKRSGPGNSPAATGPIGRRARPCRRQGLAGGGLAQPPPRVAPALPPAQLARASPLRLTFPARSTAPSHCTGAAALFTGLHQSGRSVKCVAGSAINVPCTSPSAPHARRYRPAQKSWRNSSSPRTRSSFDNRNHAIKARDVATGMKKLAHPPASGTTAPIARSASVRRAWPSTGSASSFGGGFRPRLWRN